MRYFCHRKLHLCLSLQWHYFPYYFPCYFLGDFSDSWAFWSCTSRYM